MMRLSPPSPRVRSIGIALVVLALSLICAASASAETPVWTVHAVSAPTNFAPGDISGRDKIIVTAINLSDAPAEGGLSTLSLSDTLPPGLTASEIFGTAGSEIPMTCTLVPLGCTYSGTLPPYGYLQAVINVTVGAGTAGSAQNRMNVSGGGAAPAAGSSPVAFSSTPAGFGVDLLDAVSTNEDGSLDTQAGSHPFTFTTTFGVNEEITAQDTPRPAELAKDVDVELPPGLIGNPSTVSQCSATQFRTLTELPFHGAACPDSSAIGIALVSLTGLAQGMTTVWTPVYNLVPAVGEPARLGFVVAAVPVYLDTRVRTGRDYGVTVTSSNIDQLAGFAGISLTVWGVPADPRHDAARGRCVNLFEGPQGSCSVGDQALAPFLTLPGSCTGPLTTSASSDSWAKPGEFVRASVVSHDLNGTALGQDGCDRLPFSQSISVAPDGEAASTPTGLTVGLHVNQSSGANPEGLADAEVKSTTVTLPAGEQLSPAAADGRQGCSVAQIGFEGVNPQTQSAEFTPGRPTCPEASKIGVVQIKTPVLPNELTGAVYLAAPQNFSGVPPENPFSSLVALYIVAEDPVSGVLVKLAGKTSLDPVSGQVTTTFDNTPQVPFEDLKLNFFGSARAPLTTPPLCGSYETAASIAPWSGNGAVQSSSRFDITSGPNGTPCADPRPFAPGFQAGSTNLQASAFTPFTLTMTRPDADQALGSVSMQMPSGLLGMLSSVKLCPEPQAQQGTCGADSLIGETVVSAGLGGDPYTVTGGKVYITGPYKGAPYGLSIVNPAAAGPFVLDEGRPVVVRASINVDRSTAVLRISSDPLPTILDGIPLQIQRVNVTIGRPGFTFNPSNCEPLRIAGTLASNEGATAPVSTAFQVTNCANLKFKPKFSVSTSGKTSKANGASLTAKLAYPSAVQGTQSNIAYVKVDLPKQLPSRLTTLQKACIAATFNANPASCPAGSIVGHATVTTPLLPVPLTGPAYFVSHGGEAFPSLTMVLQGYGVTIELVGTTFIDKKGITSTTFKTVPDTPFSTFTLTLPQGRGSALGANGNLCRSKLVMPTAFIAQNGAQIHQNTPITTTGCPKAKKHAKKKHGKKHSSKRSKRSKKR